MYQGPENTNELKTISTLEVCEIKSDHKMIMN